MIAWLAGEPWVLEEFKGDGLIYEATAAMMFHKVKNDIKKRRSARGSPSERQGATLPAAISGVGALKRMGALESGIPEEELPGIVNRWRRANPHIVRFWYDVENARSVRYRASEWHSGMASSFSVNEDTCSFSCRRAADWRIFSRA